MRLTELNAVERCYLENNLDARPEQLARELRQNGRKGLKAITIRKLVEEIKEIEQEKQCKWECGKVGMAVDKSGRFKRERIRDKIKNNTL